MSSEEEDLRLAIVTDPDDDAPRLAWADLLDRRGRREVAEFVRVQVAMSSHPLIGAAKSASGVTLAGHLAHTPSRLKITRTNGGSIVGDAATGSRCVCDWCALRRREQMLYEAADDFFYAEADNSVLTWGLDLFRTDLEHWECRRGLPSRLTNVRLLAMRTAADAGFNVFRLWPVTSVAVADKSPATLLRTSEELESPEPYLLHYYFREGVPHDAFPESTHATLPPAVYDQLAAPKQDTHKVYGSAEEAVADLSGAVVRWCRAEAGLPQWWARARRLSAGEDVSAAT